MPRLLLPLVFCLLLACDTPDVPPDPPDAGDLADGSGGAQSAASAHAAPPGAGDPRQPDSAQYLLGPVLKGRVVDGEGLTPIAGAAVSEVGSGAPAVRSDGDGWFKLDLRDEAVVAVVVRHEGFVDTIQVATEASRPYFEGEYWIELFSLADREAATADYGAPLEADRGEVVLNFQPYGSAGGVRATLDVPGIQAWMYDAGDHPVRGDRFGPDPFAGEFRFWNVPAGSPAVTIEPPDRLACPGPAKVPVLAGTSTRSYYFCQPAPPPVPVRE